MELLYVTSRTFSNYSYNNLKNELFNARVFFISYEFTANLFELMRILREFNECESIPIYTPIVQPHVDNEHHVFIRIH